MSNDIQKKHKVSTLDVADFCGVSDMEAISEDGICFIIQEVLKQTEKGWTFVECDRHFGDGTIRLYFTK